jgi:hypothetical protein
VERASTAADYANDAEMAPSHCTSSVGPRLQCAAQCSSSPASPHMTSCRHILKTQGTLSYTHKAMLLPCSTTPCCIIPFVLQVVLRRTTAQAAQCPRRQCS